MGCATVPFAKKRQRHGRKVGARVVCDRAFYKKASKARSKLRGKGRSRPCLLQKNAKGTVEKRRRGSSVTVPFAKKCQRHGRKAGARVVRYRAFCKKTAKARSKRCRPVGRRLFIRKAARRAALRLISKAARGRRASSACRQPRTPRTPAHRQPRTPARRRPRTPRAPHAASPAPPRAASPRPAAHCTSARRRPRAPQHTAHPTTPLAADVPIRAPSVPPGPRTTAPHNAHPLHATEPHPTLRTPPRSSLW